MLDRRQLLALGLAVAGGVACAGAAPAQGPAADPDLLFAGEWSTDVGGLCGRLVIARGKLLADGKLRETVAYLELKYAPGAVNEVEIVQFDPNLTCELRDPDNKPVSQNGRIGGGGGRPGAQTLTLPYDSTIRLRLSPYGFGSPDGLRIIIGANEWNIKDTDPHAYSLAGEFTSQPAQDRTQHNLWRGTLALRPLKIEARPAVAR